MRVPCRYDPVDLLQIPEKATTRALAVDAIRLCDRQCTLLFNQSHCIKNAKHLVASLIEHVFTQVLAVPKPRPVPHHSAKRLKRAAAAAARRAEREAKEAKEKAVRAAAWAEFKHGKKKDAKGEAKGKARAASSAAGDDGDEETKAATAAAVAAQSEAAAAEEAAMDKAAGLVAEEDAVGAACYWDQPITYDLQVELLLTLGRLAEGFSAAAMSIQHSRSFDAVCTVVPGVMAAIGDAVLRRLATDRPSELSGILMGMTADGRQLGIAGFGCSVGTFSEQTETMEIHYPELSVRASERGEGRGRGVGKKHRPRCAESRGEL